MLTLEEYGRNSTPYPAEFRHVDGSPMASKIPFRSVRKAAAITLAFFAGLVCLLAALVALTLPPQLKREALYAKQFRQAEFFVVSYQIRTHEFPDEKTLNKRFSKDIYPSWMFVADDCIDKKFQKTPQDNFVINLWRGEWADCYASPSGKTNLATGREALKGWVLYFALQLAFAALLGVCAWFTWPKRKQS